MFRRIVDRVTERVKAFFMRPVVDSDSNNDDFSFHVDSAENQSGILEMLHKREREKAEEFQTLLVTLRERRAGNIQPVLSLNKLRQVLATDEELGFKYIVEGELWKVYPTTNLLAYFQDPTTDYYLNLVLHLAHTRATIYPLKHVILHLNTDKYDQYGVLLFDVYLAGGRLTQEDFDLLVSIVNDDVLLACLRKLKLTPCWVTLKFGLASMLHKRLTWQRRSLFQTMIKENLYNTLELGLLYEVMAPDTRWVITHLINAKVIANKVHGGVIPDPPLSMTPDQIVLAARSLGMDYVIALPEDHKLHLLRLTRDAEQGAMFSKEMNAAEFSKGLSLEYREQLWKDVEVTPNVELACPLEPGNIGTIPSQVSERTREKQEDNNGCSICFDERSNTLFLPCKHLACCQTCSEQLLRCHICRVEIVEKITAYLS